MPFKENKVLIKREQKKIGAYVAMSYTIGVVILCPGSIVNTFSFTLPLVSLVFCFIFFQQRILWLFTTYQMLFHLDRVCLFLVHIILLSSESLIFCSWKWNTLWYSLFRYWHRKLPTGLSLKFSAHFCAFIHMTMCLEKGEKNKR